MAFSFISVLWNKWNIRGFVMLSLWLQGFLILFAPLRKKTSNRAILSLLWLAYLMADWVAAFAIGLISHSQCNSSTQVAEVDGALSAFWASFLLLHLGGPDTITAFSMEDSMLWRRHLLGLVFQVGSAIYVFVQIFPTDMSLVIPTILVFLAGLIKNAERTVALNLSSLPKLREWVFSQRRRLDDVAEEFARDSTVSQLKYSNEEEVKLAESIVVKHAYSFFQMFMVLLGDLMFTSKEREVSREYFHKVSSMDAFRVISTELQFMYEVLHTKTLAIHSKWSYIFRFIAFTNVVMAFVLFNHSKKHQLPTLDLKITHSLLFGGIALDVIALFMLIFSDWIVAGIKRVSFLYKIISITDFLRKPQFVPCGAHPNPIPTYMAFDTPLIFQRWSESISACNLLSHFSRTCPRKMWKHGRHWDIISFSSIDNFLMRMFEKMIDKILLFPNVSKSIAKYYFGRPIVPRIANTNNVSKNPLIKELWIFIFKEVRRKSKKADNEVDVRKIFEAKGDFFLDEAKGKLFLENEMQRNTCNDLLVSITEANFDTNIIMWHIATEIWYNKETTTDRNDEREFSKILSDYMMYLLINQPNLVSTVAGIGQIRSGKVREEMRYHILLQNLDVKELCNELYNLQFIEFGAEFLLYKAVDLARNIQRLGELKWIVMNGVWVEMLSYAATHIKGEAHVQVLSKGGEFLAFVWLLMAHFGCFCKPEWGICMNMRWMLLGDLASMSGDPNFLLTRQ